MSILFIQNWDVIQGKEQECSEFIGETYIPETAAMGFVPVGGYYVEIGFGPRVLAVYSAETLDELSKFVTSKEFKNLTLGLKRFVRNYKRSVYEPTGAVKRGKYTIQKGVWKFNQYYNIRPGLKESYADFIINEHLPTMETIDYVEVTGGWNTIFGGFREIIAEFTFKDPVDIGRLMNNEDFKRITTKLKINYVEQYTSRVLRSTERFDEPKWFRL